MAELGELVASIAFERKCRFGCTVQRWPILCNTSTNSEGQSDIAISGAYVIIVIYGPYKLGTRFNLI